MMASLRMVLLMDLAISILEGTPSSEGSQMVMQKVREHS
jgi:hypothetical protein